jgi:diguanylate cyclase (GGDEF)-like protein
VVSSAGFPPGQVPDHSLIEAAETGRETFVVPGLGPCRTLVLPLGDADFLLVARRNDAFTPEEDGLLRGVSRLLALTLRTFGALEAERRRRLESERHAEEDRRLLAALQERQTLLERLFQIQRSISHRIPVQEVLDSITAGTAELLGGEVATVRIIDEDDPEFTRMVSSVGLSPRIIESIHRAATDQGLSGKAMIENRLIVADDYTNDSHAVSQVVSFGMRSAMAAPLSRDGEVVGSLIVCSSQPRHYSPLDQEVFLALAEHASLALNEATTMAGMRQAFDTALHQANHDALTGVPNRTLVLERLAEALERARHHGSRVTVFFADLDRFKVVNDSLGHTAGDRLLVRVSERLLVAMREGDTVGRLAGDEFVVICEGLSDEDTAAIAQRIARAIAEPMWLNGRETVITASIGIAQSECSTQAEDMLRDSDVAMYRAKERGRSQAVQFDSAMRLHMLDRLEMERALRGAIAKGELRLHYQPIFRLDELRMGAAEALVRWQHPERGMVSPADFIPLAEESGLILPLGRWVLNEACRQVAAWRASGHPNLRIAVNLSGRQFADPDLVHAVAEALSQAGLPADALWLEITESVLMEEVEATAETLRGLKSLGLHLSVDDFGTGYSSLSYLKRFPVDTLKIDRSFVDGLGTDAEDSAIVAAVVSLARALNLSVVAEGVERVEQVHELRRLGCDSAQGFLLGRPVPADAFAELALPKLDGFFPTVAA